MQHSRHSLGLRVYNANNPATLHVPPLRHALPNPPLPLVNKQKLIHDREETGIKIRVGIQVQCTSSDVSPSLSVSLSGQANEIKFICISSTCRAGTGVSAWRACATAGGTHVPTNSSAMSQCATVCRNFPTGVVSQLGETRSYRHGYGYVPRIGGSMGLHVVLPACSLHVTRLYEK